MNLNSAQQQWNVEVYEQGHFEKFFRSLDEIDQAIVGAAVEYILKPLGTEICSTEWGKNLKKGLYELRIRRDLSTILSGFASPELANDVPLKWRNRKVVIRGYCTFHGNKAVLLLGGYDKLRNGEGEEGAKGNCASSKGTTRVEKKQLTFYVFNHIIVTAEREPNVYQKL